MDSCEVRSSELEASSSLHEEHSSLLEKAGLTYHELPSEERGFRPGDVLVVVDMQNDFLPAADAPEGGRFGVAEGAEAAAAIIPLIEACCEAGGKVVATRDYHPKNHSSFTSQGGAFPAHCVQGTRGSHFYPPIAEALVAARLKNPDRVIVCFKGTHLMAHPQPDPPPPGRSCGNDEPSQSLDQHDGELSFDALML